MATSSAPLSVTGGCLCGAVRYVMTGPLRPVSICHCAMCRRSTSSLGAYTACAPEAIALTETKLRWYRSSPIARRGFCGRCGSQLFWEPGHGRHLSVAAGSLDDQSILAMGEQIYVADDDGPLRALAPVTSSSSDLGSPPCRRQAQTDPLEGAGS